MNILTGVNMTLKVTEIINDLIGFNGDSMEIQRTTKA